MNPDEGERRPRPDCSVVVATYNRREGLRRLLRSLEAQDIGTDRFEVIVVDDGSTDGTWQMLSEMQTSYRLRWLWQRNQGPAAARNAAVEAACGEIIVTLDDDVEAAPDLLRRHLEAHTDDRPMAAIGRFAPPPDRHRLQAWTDWEFSGLERQYRAMERGDWLPTPRQFYTANSSVPRRGYFAAGMFDPLFRRAEDVEFAYRLRDQGFGFRFLPDAVIHHRPYRSFDGWKSIASQYGFYDTLMWRRRGRSHIPRVIADEFLTQRARSLQLLARLLVGRKRLLQGWVALASCSVRVMDRIGWRRACRPLLSGIFNLLYWQSVSEGLGGRREFLQLVSGGPALTAQSAAAQPDAPRGAS